MMTTAQPVAYIRKSVVHNDVKSVSWEVQEAKVRELAALNGDNHGRLLILSDWNISGRKGSAGRPGYARLLEMIESGEASSVYSYNLARLSRSVQDLRALMALADAHHVPVRLVADHVDTSTATGRMLLTILSAVDEMIADLASEHARDAVVERRARGDVIGRATYGSQDGEDIAVIIAAFRRAGSYHGAARILTEEGYPTRLGGPWRATTVRVLLRRYAPGVVPPGQRQGAKSAPPFRLARLLTCRCGRTLTGVNQKGHPRYVCTMATDDPRHGTPKSVSESEIIGWVRDEIAHLDLGVDAVQLATDNAAQRTALAGRLERASEEYVAGRWNRERRDREAADVAAEIGKLGSAETIIEVPEIDWDKAPAVVNASLRAILERVTLDAAMRPASAVWNVPEWRAE
jgi:DNA invertase Pin-like site-specific DNA recombinase